MGAPNVRDGESVDTEIDSGAEVSSLPVNIGADTYPLHETRSACVAVTMLRLVAVSCMSLVQESWFWKLMRCEATRGTSILALACEVLRGEGEQVQKRSRRQDSLRAAQVRESTAAFCGEDS